LASESEVHKDSRSCSDCDTRERDMGESHNARIRRVGWDGENRPVYLGGDFNKKSPNHRFDDSAIEKRKMIGLNRLEDHGLMMVKDRRDLRRDQLLFLPVFASLKV